MNSRAPLPPTIQASEWAAWLNLGFTHGPRGTQLSRCNHQGPLYVQKPFYPEGSDCAHAYLLHPPGGLVSGDHLQIAVNVDQNAHALLTTPGAGRAYRARPDRTLQHQHISLNAHENATLEWLPQETLLYPDARARLDTDIHLNDGARFIGWDITCLGLPASKQPFQSGELSQRLQVIENGRVALREHLHLTNANRKALNGRLGFRDHSVNAIMIAGPFHEPLEPDAMKQLKHHCSEFSELAGVSQVDRYLVIRALANRAEPVKKLLTQCWAPVRQQLFSRSVCEPRIWAT
ncbi:urease accessory protein UreD [Saccharospirillum alexandrii]|uniref:urease accessory protein UreD n=1 Tax=Saccharospirillum alexandrii TaxID=2448477 RepID=UPI00373650CA